MTKGSCEKVKGTVAPDYFGLKFISLDRPLVTLDGQSHKKTHIFIINVSIIFTGMEQN